MLTKLDNNTQNFSVDNFLIMPVKLCYTIDKLTTTGYVQLRVSTDSRPS